jgi:hypothetical protein
MRGQEATDHREDGLPRWATITQVSEALAIPRDTVRSAVRRAAASSEVWVKKEVAPDGTAVYLIDTQHASYQAHEARWKQGTTARQHLASWLRIPPECVISMWSKEQTMRDGETAEDHASSRSNEQETSGFSAGPRVWQWLAAGGLEIFTNCLAPAGQAYPWQWHWNELHGAGYGSVEEALLAALQARFDAYEREREDLTTTLLHTLEREDGEESEPGLEEEPEEQSMWLRIFSHKNRSW